MDHISLNKAFFQFTHCYVVLVSLNVKSHHTVHKAYDSLNMIVVS